MFVLMSLYYCKPSFPSMGPINCMPTYTIYVLLAIKNPES